MKVKHKQSLTQCGRIPAITISCLLHKSMLGTVAAWRREALASADSPQSWVIVSGTFHFPFLQLSHGPSCLSPPLVNWGGGGWLLLLSLVQGQGDGGSALWCCALCLGFVPELQRLCGQSAVAVAAVVTSPHTTHPAPGWSRLWPGNPSPPLA